MHRMPPPPPPSPLPSLPSLPSVHSFLIKTEPLPSLPSVGIAALLNPAADDKRSARGYTHVSAPRPAEPPTHFPADAMAGATSAAPVRAQKRPTAFRDSMGSPASVNDSEAAEMEDEGLAQAPQPKKKRKARICKTEGCEKYVVDRGLCIRHGGGKRCSVDGCNCRAQNRGLCWKHGGYTRCTVEGCTKRAKSRGICWSHGGGTRCKHAGCAKIAVSHGLCWAHGGGKRCLVDGCQKPAYERNGNLCAEHCQDAPPQ